MFKEPISNPESELEEAYVQFLSTLLGWTQDSARNEVKNAIEACKQAALEEGSHELPANLGNIIISACKQSDYHCKKIVNKAKAEGATDNDIREWWNLPDLNRRMVIWSENMFRYASFLSFVNEEKLSPDEAMVHIKKMYPMYGNPEDEQHSTGDDRPLPNEIRGRVDKYRTLKGAAYIQKLMAGYSSYNAFIRKQIRDGKV